VRIALISALLVLTLAACGGSAGSPAPGTDAPVGGAVQVGIADFAYDPQSATASVGQTVTWTNNDSTPHTVTFDDGPDLGQIGNGGTLTHTFAAAGEFAYQCSIHPSMRGTVTVQ